MKQFYRILLPTSMCLFSIIVSIIMSHYSETDGFPSILHSFLGILAICSNIGNLIFFSGSAHLK